MYSMDESNRLNDLRLYQILDTAAEKAFDDLTRVAAAICGTSISLVSLVDRDRQWFKSRHGLEVSQTPRAYAFCAYAMEGEDIMVVEDARADDRFADNPLVVGAPNIRFYAGMPLIVASGSALGTLCVIDHEPQALSAMQIEALRVLRDAVVSQLELRRAREDLKKIQKVLPMCAWCRKVRLDDEADNVFGWQPLDEFVLEMNTVNHEICPDCMASEDAAIKREGIRS